MNIERLYFKIPEIFRVIKKNDIDMKFQNANCRLYETNNLEVCKECSTCDEGTNDILIIEIKRGIQVLRLSTL